MYSISNFYNIDIYELAKTNGIADLKNLPVGTKLIISNYKQKQEVAKPSVYTVKKGDTLFSIAKANGVKTDYLQKINNMPTIDIKIGQQILLTQNFIQSEQPEHSTNSTDANGAMQVGKGIKQNNDESQSKVQSSDVISKPVKLSSKGFLWPVDGVVSEKFGTKKNGVKNDGILIDAPQGTPVKASKSGVVAYVGSELKDYGNLVIVNCDQFLVIYAHLLSVNVKKGQKIQSGETIGLVGKTGNVSSPKLFFSIRSSKKNQKNGSQLTLYDPLKFLDKEHG
jgi:murein DD-endopeptidase MepM/ murein hydrolase activator NlpD